MAFTDNKSFLSRFCWKLSCNTTRCAFTTGRIQSYTLFLFCRNNDDVIMHSCCYKILVWCCLSYPAWTIFQNLFCRHSDGHIDMKALLYHCCTCACGVIKFLPSCNIIIIFQLSRWIGLLLYSLKWEELFLYKLYTSHVHGYADYNLQQASFSFWSSLGTYTNHCKARHNLVILCKCTCGLEGSQSSVCVRSGRLVKLPM